MRSVVVLALLCSPVGDCVPHRLPSRLVGEVAQVRRIKESPVLCKRKLIGADGSIIGYRGVMMLNGEEMGRCWSRDNVDWQCPADCQRPRWAVGVEREVE